MAALPERRREREERQDHPREDTEKSSTTPQKEVSTGLSLSLGVGDCFLSWSWDWPTFLMFGVALSHEGRPTTKKECIEGGERQHDLKERGRREVSPLAKEENKHYLLFLMKH